MAVLTDHPRSPWPEPDSELRGDSFERVLIVAASSRGGSSFLYSLLTASPSAMFIGGEHTALYRLQGITLGSNGSDEIPVDAPSQEQVAKLVRDLCDMTRIVKRSPAVNPEQYCRVLYQRLTLQWPLELWDPAEVREVALGVFKRTHGGDLQIFKDILDLLSSAHPAVDPRYYDGLEARSRWRGLQPPPSSFLVEEPPFVVPSLKLERPTNAQARARVLVLKASVDAYRLPLLRRLFPRAELAVVHLTRNPAASINGLFDGWLDRGFYSYEVAEPYALQIQGYSELAPFASRWWNFDIPPSWKGLTGMSLMSVCAYQWSGAHRAILTSIDATADKSLRVRFEDLVEPKTRQACGDQLFEFANMEAPPNFTVPRVMSTSAPEAARWRRREVEVGCALAEPGVDEVQRALGYGRPNASWI